MGIVRIVKLPVYLFNACQESDLPNVVPEQPVHQVLEFSITLMDSGYQEILRDTDSPQYHDLSRHLQEQVTVFNLEQLTVKNQIYMICVKRHTSLCLTDATCF